MLNGRLRLRGSSPSGRHCLDTFEIVFIRRTFMRTWLAHAALFSGRMSMKISAVVALLTIGATAALAQPEAAGGEASLKLPDLSQVSFFNGAIDGHKLLLIGIIFCILGLGFVLEYYML